jgi:hypothetical protein
MDRARVWFRPGIALLAIAMLAAPLAGCASTLATAMYVIKGTNVDAEFDGLKEKRVAVVCRQLASLQYRDSNVPRDLATQIGSSLSNNVSKITVIDQQQVAEWTDENEWEEFTEIGRALDVDMVVGVELEDFRLHQGQTLYQGRANVEIKVYDLKQGGKMVFSKTPKPSIYPPNAAVPTSEKQEGQFRREYVKVLAEEISRHFYDHDSRVNFAVDSTAF